MDNIVIQTNACLYTVKRGILNMYEGDVHKTWQDWEGLFKTGNKNIPCSSQSKFVVNGMVWLLERNDDLARDLLIQYEEAQIAMLERGIEINRIKIKMLKGEIEKC